MKHLIYHILYKSGMIIILYTSQASLMYGRLKFICDMIMMEGNELDVAVLHYGLKK